MRLSDLSGAEPGVQPVLLPSAPHTWQPLPRSQRSANKTAAVAVMTCAERARRPERATKFLVSVGISSGKRRTMLSASATGRAAGDQQVARTIAFFPIFYAVLRHWRGCDKSRRFPRRSLPGALPGIEHAGMGKTQRRILGPHPTRAGCAHPPTPAPARQTSRRRRLWRAAPAGCQTGFPRPGDVAVARRRRQFTEQARQPRPLRLVEFLYCRLGFPVDGAFEAAERPVGRKGQKVGGFSDCFAAANN